MASSPGSSSPLSGFSLLVDAIRKPEAARTRDAEARKVLGALTEGFVPVTELPARAALQPEVVIKVVNDLRAEKAIGVRQSNGQYLVGLTSKGHAEAFEE